MDHCHYPVEAHMPDVLTTRTVYVNRNFTRENTKVLVNPNFKRSVHINPNFSSHPAINVYVNPSILQTHAQIKPPPQVPSKSVPVKVSRFTKINKITTRPHLAPSQNNYVYHPPQNHQVTNVVLATPTPVLHMNLLIPKPEQNNRTIPHINLVIPTFAQDNRAIPHANFATQNNRAIPYANMAIPKSAPTHQVIPKSVQSHKLPQYSRVIHKNLQKINDPRTASKFKRDFSSRNIKLIKRDTTKSPPTSRKVVNSKYKIVRLNSDNKRRSVSPKKIMNKFKLDNRVTSKSKLKLNAKAYLMNFDPQRQIIKKALYRSKKPVAKKLPKVVKINGVTYKFSPKYDILYKVTRSTKFDASKVRKRIVIHGIPYVQKDSLTYVRKYANLVKINKKVLKKDNNPCLVFRRTGKCIRFVAGKCIKQHDPKQISICIRFLQGACYDKTCLLSHNVSSEKMPTCKYFLEGRCSNDDCQYLHVKLSGNAEVCKDFLEGYCMNGSQCMKRHQFLCPVFEKNKGCNKRSCPYPHGEAVRQYTDKILNKIARTTPHCKKSKKVEKAEPDPSRRYYKEEPAGGVELESKCDSDSGETNYVKRPKLGELPSFIGFED